MARLNERAVVRVHGAGILTLGLDVNGRGRGGHVDPGASRRKAGGGGAIPLHGGASVISGDRRQARGHALARVRAQVVEGFDVAEIGLIGEIAAEHPDFLALVDERCAALEEIRGRKGSCRLEPGGGGLTKARHRAWLIMILQVESVPPPIAEGLLPAREDLGELAICQGAR